MVNITMPNVPQINAQNSVVLLRKYVIKSLAIGANNFPIKPRIAHGIHNNSPMKITQNSPISFSR